jgi:hypothetical protein
MRHIAVLTVGLQLALGSALASAQTRVDIVPSATIGSTYDNNLFAETKGSAGQMLTLRPGFQSVIKSPRFDLDTEFSFDAQRSNFATLNTLDARRHASLDTHYKTSPANSIGFGARYDRTQTPGDLELTTGLLGDRRQAHRIQLTPSLEHRVWQRTYFRGSYDYVDESVIEGASGQMHTVRTGLNYGATPRTTLTASYMGRQFVDHFDDNLSNTVLLGGERLIAPGTRISLQAGPSFSSYRGLQAEIEAGFVRSTERVGLVFDYWHGETIVLGVRGPVAVNSLSGRAVFPFTRHIEIGTHTGVSDIATLDHTRATIYRGTLVASWKPDAWYSVAGSYGLDYQLGDIRRGRVVLDGTEFIFNDKVLRHVFSVSLTIAPRLSRLQSPADPAARAKGVTR